MIRLLSICCAVVALAACAKPQQQAQNESASAAESGPQKGVDRSHNGQRAPDVAIGSSGGKAEKFSDFGGKPRLVNLWATWCAPCVKELPTLGRLAKAHEKDGALEVVAISQDSGPHQSVEAFLASKAPELDAYQDPKMELSGKLAVEVLPTSILYDAKGREVWRYVGDLDWTGPEAAKLLAQGGVAPPG